MGEAAYLRGAVGDRVRLRFVGGQAWPPSTGVGCAREGESMLQRGHHLVGKVLRLQSQWKLLSPPLQGGGVQGGEGPLSPPYCKTHLLRLFSADVGSAWQHDSRASRAGDDIE
jgi:hypothetical protein